MPSITDTDIAIIVGILAALFAAFTGLASRPLTPLEQFARANRTHSRARWRYGVLVEQTD